MLRPFSRSSRGEMLRAAGALGWIHFPFQNPFSSGASVSEAAPLGNAAAPEPLLMILTCHCRCRCLPSSPGVLVGPQTAGRRGSLEPLSGGPGTAAHIRLVLHSRPLTLLPAGAPPSLCSIPFGSPHFSLEWVSYPQLSSGLTQLNTNKTHSTQVEQGARASMTND